MPNNQRFYQILGINTDASEIDIKKAYRNLALKHHPDKGGDSEKFKEISLAYETLSDPGQKEIYDKFGEEGLKHGNGNGNGNQHNFHDPFNFFQSFFGGGGGGGGFNFNIPRQRQQKSPEITHIIYMTLEEIYNGKSINVTLHLDHNCPHCRGSGTKPDCHPISCGGCNGKGIKIFTKVIGPGMMQQFHGECEQCHGKGKLIKKEDECDMCKGKQTIEMSKNFSFNLPKGVSGDDRIMMNGVGHQHPDKIQGDIRFQIQESPHHIFQREGYNLIVNKKITLLDALSGFQFSLVCLDGVERIIQSRGPINPIKEPNKQIINNGLPHRNNPGIRGSLILHFDVEYPTELVKSPLESTSLGSHLNMTRLMNELDITKEGPNILII
jgi:DnaJ family protein A protein 2